MFQLPFAMEFDQQRLGHAPVGPPVALGTPELCRRACINASACTSWTYTQGNASCQLQGDAVVPDNFYAPGVVSGVYSRWVVHAEPQCLVMVRSRGAGPAVGDITMCASVDGDSYETAFSTRTSDDMGAAFGSFQGTVVSHVIFMALRPPCVLSRAGGHTLRRMLVDIVHGLKE